MRPKSRVFVVPSSFNESSLPDDVITKIETLKKQLKGGDITLKGFQKHKFKLLRPYLDNSTEFEEYVASTYPPSSAGAASTRALASSKASSSKSPTTAHTETVKQENDDSEAQHEVHATFNRRTRRRNLNMLPLIEGDYDVDGADDMNGDTQALELSPWTERNGVVVSQEDAFLADWIEDTRRKEVSTGHISLI